MQQVGNDILAALGGRRFLVMTGARYPVAIEDGLQFRLPQTKYENKQINFVKITLNKNDLFDIEFWKDQGVLKRDPVLVETHSDIFVEDLQRIFTSVTGLDTHL